MPGTKKITPPPTKTAEFELKNRRTNQNGKIGPCCILHTTLNANICF